MAPTASGADSARPPCPAPPQRLALAGPLCSHPLCPAHNQGPASARYSPPNYATVRGLTGADPRFPAAPPWNLERVRAARGPPQVACVLGVVEEPGGAAPGRCPGRGPARPGRQVLPPLGFGHDRAGVRPPGTTPHSTSCFLSSHRRGVSGRCPTPSCLAYSVLDLVLPVWLSTDSAPGGWPLFGRL